MCTLISMYYWNHNQNCAAQVFYRAFLGEMFRNLVLNVYTESLSGSNFDETKFFQLIHFASQQLQIYGLIWWEQCFDTEAFIIYEPLNVIRYSG